MALVTLSVAKGHLRIPGDDNHSDSDIYTKVEQASAIVMDYIKARSIAIASVSVANPTVITTAVPHSLTTGATTTIAGTSSTPTVTGAQVVTATGSTTFTVPVNVTVGQATAAGTVSRPVWTETTVPGPVQSAVLLMLTHLYEHRGEDMTADQTLWLAIDRLLCRYRDPALA